MPDDHSRRKWSMSADDDAADVESEARRGPSALRAGPRRLGLLCQGRRASRRGGPAFNDHGALPGQCPTTIRAANGRCRLTTTQLTSSQKRDGVPRRFAPDRVAWACCVRAGALRDAAALPQRPWGIAWAMPDDDSRRKWSMSADDDAADVESGASRGSPTPDCEWLRMPADRRASRPPLVVAWVEFEGLGCAPSVGQNRRSTSAVRISCVSV